VLAAKDRESRLAGFQRTACGTPKGTLPRESVCGCGSFLLKHVNTGPAHYPQRCRTGSRARLGFRLVQPVTGAVFRG
jgi:hypothetical protein